jgi:lysophospholipase L1-like esterase
MREIRYITYIVLSCILLFVGYKVYVKWKSEHEVSRTINTMRYQDMVASFNDSEIDTSTIVFLGNSLIEHFNLSQFNNPHIVNRGISGDFTEGVITRMDGIITRHPKKIFLEIGINDLIEKIALKTIGNNYEIILEKIIKVSPKTQIFIHSLLPTKLHGSIITSANNINQRVMEFNNMLLNLSEKYHCTYIDTWSHFATKDNSMNPSLTDDGIHLTPEGYKIWVAVIKNLVN